MKRGAPLSLFMLASALSLLAVSDAAIAQDSTRDDQGNLGARLFNQSCSVCHLKQQLGTNTYAPALSQDTLGGKADIMREVITNGTPRMPGFKIQYTPAQIDAIVGYLKTIPVAAAATPTTKARGPGEPD